MRRVTITTHPLMLGPSLNLRRFSCVPYLRGEKRANEKEQRLSPKEQRALWPACRESAFAAGSCHQKRAACAAACGRPASGQHRASTSFRVSIRRAGHCHPLSTPFLGKTFVHGYFWSIADSAQNAHRGAREHPQGLSYPRESFQVVRDMRAERLNK